MESMEPDHNEDKDQRELKQEEETGELTEKSKIFRADKVKFSQNESSMGTHDHA
jgi:hypothetical protein